MGRSSVVYAQAIFHDGVCVASGRTIMALIDVAARRAVPMPDEVLSLLQRLQMRVSAVAR